MSNHLHVDPEIAIQNILQNFRPTVDGNKWGVKDGDMYYEFQTYELSVKDQPIRNILLISKYDLSGKSDRKKSQGIFDFQKDGDFYTCTLINFNGDRITITEDNKFTVEGSLFKSDWAQEMSLTESLRRTWDSEGPEVQYVRYSAKVASLSSIKILNDVETKSYELSVE